MKKKVEHTKDAKEATFILQIPWKPKSLAVKLVDIGLEFPDDSESEFIPEKDEDVSTVKDAVDEDLLRCLEALSCHAAVASKEDKKGVCYLCGKKGHRMADCNLLKLLIKNAQRGLGLKPHAWKMKDPS